MGHDKKHDLGDTANHGTTTLDELNALLSDATIGDLGSAPTKYVYVATNGSDVTGDGSFTAPYATIAQALTSITDNSATLRYCISVAPGTYTSAPVTNKSYVTIRGASKAATVITASTTTSPIITAVDYGNVENLTLKDASGTGGAGITLSAASSFAVFSNIDIDNCYEGVRISSATCRAIISNVTIVNAVAAQKGVAVTAGRVSIDGLIARDLTIGDVFFANSSYTDVDIRGLAVTGGDIYNGARVESNANVRMCACDIRGEALNLMTNGIFVTGGAYLYATACRIEYCTYGIDTTGDGIYLDINGCMFDNNTNGVRMRATTTAATCFIGSSMFHDNTTYDVEVEDADWMVEGGGNFINEEKISVVAGAGFFMSYMSSIAGDERLNVDAELNVGSIERPRETTQGEGDSYTNGLLAYTWNGTVYTDITADVKSSSGSTFTFPSTTTNDAIYLSSDRISGETSDYHQFEGIKMDMTTARSGGTIVAEYWNGSAWTSFTHMTAQSSGDYFRKADALFTAATGSYQVRFNPFITSDWTKNDPPTTGTNRFWVRFRISSSPTTAPIFEQFKLHANRSEVNGDGYPERMGRARSYKALPVNWNLFKDAGTALSNQDLWLTSNCKSGITNNLFNTDGDSVGTITSLPSWADTSAPMKILVSLVSAATGDLTMSAYFNSSSEGDTISTTDPSSTTGELSDSQTKGVTANQQEWFELEIDISRIGTQADGTFPDSMWINVVATTRPGNVYGMQMEISLLEWRVGNHV